MTGGRRCARITKRPSGCSAWPPTRACGLPTRRCARSRGSWGARTRFARCTTGTFFGEPGVEVPDPYFGGEGPARSGCIHCGACMVGCRHNAKNTLVKNYLYLAEKWGAEVRAEAEVRDVRPLPANQPDGARYEVIYRRTTAAVLRAQMTPRARPQRDRLRRGAGHDAAAVPLPRPDPLAAEALAASGRQRAHQQRGAARLDQPRLQRRITRQGIAITSIFNADDVTTVEPVRYPAGSSLMRLLAGPMTSGRNLPERFVKSVAQIVLKLPQLRQRAVRAALGGADDHPAGDAARGQPDPDAAGAQPVHLPQAQSGVAAGRGEDHPHADRNRAQRRARASPPRPTASRRGRSTRGCSTSRSRRTSSAACRSGRLPTRA